MAPETRLKISQTLKGRKKPEGFGVGRIMSEETRRKISLAHMGMPVSEETREKLRQANLGKPCPEEVKVKKRQFCGSAHPNWRGGRTPEIRLARKNGAYSEWRKKVFQRDNFTCQDCGDRGVELNADHIQSFTFFPDLRYELSNGRTLCVPCHRLTPNFGSKAKKLHYAS